jgi:hypothetical protein
MLSGTHTRALGSEGGSPAANGGRAWQTNGTMPWLDSTRVDWWWWRGRRWLRRAAAARLRRRARCGSSFGKAWGGGGQCAAMGATQVPREEVERVGRRWELAEARARGGSNGGRRRCSRTEGVGRLLIAGRACRSEVASRLSVLVH